MGLFVVASSALGGSSGAFQGTKTDLTRFLDIQYRKSISRVFNNSNHASHADMKHILKGFRRVILLVSAVILWLFGAACMDELQAQGGWSAPVIAEQFIYVGTTDGRVIKIDAETGVPDMSWNFLGGGQTVGTIYGSPVVTEDMLYGTGYRCQGKKCEGLIFAVDVHTGLEHWSVALATELVASVAVTEDLVLVGTSRIGDEDDSADGYLYALKTDLNTNALERIAWRFPVNGKIWGSPTVVNGVAYFGSLDGVFHAVSLRNEERFTGAPETRELWRFESGFAMVSTPLIDDRKIYVGDLGNSIIALDMHSRMSDSSGRTLDSNREWRFDAGGWIWASPVLDNSVLYVSTLTGNVHALDSKSGAELWSKPAVIQGQIVGTPVMFSVGNTRALAVPSGLDDVWVVSAVDGRDLGEFSTDGGVKASPTLRNDVVYVHTLDDELYLFSAPNFGKKSCWNLRDGSDCDQ